MYEYVEAGSDRPASYLSQFIIYVRIKHVKTKSNLK